MGYDYSDDELDGGLNKSASGARRPIGLLPFIFVGDVATASTKLFLTKEGITHVIDCTAADDDFVYPLKNDFKYQKIACEDDDEFNITEKFDPIFEALSAIKAANGKVIIFDRSCRSVPSTLVLSYMLNSAKKQEKYLPLTSAIKHVVTKDPVLTPMEAFQLHLGALEELLFEECSLDLGKKKGGRGGRGGRRR